MNPDTLTDDRELALMAEIASTITPPYCIVEVGVFRGGTLKVLAEHAQQNVPVFGVDIWGSEGTPSYYEADSSWCKWWEWYSGQDMSWDENYRHAQELAPSAILLVGESVAVGDSWDGPEIGLLYIDADHSYEGVKADWAAWEKHLAHDAVIVFDDYKYIVRGKDHYPGVTQFVDELGLPTDTLGKAAIVRRA